MFVYVAFVDGRDISLFFTSAKNGFFFFIENTIALRRFPDLRVEFNKTRCLCLYS